MKTLSTDVFAATTQVVIGNKIYIVERHFAGARDFTEAINTAVLNNTKREDSTEKTA